MIVFMAIRQKGARRGGGLCFLTKRLITRQLVKIEKIKERKVEQNKQFRCPGDAW
jgi:hypothetical protein